MNGHVLPGTPIAVDYWKIASCPPEVSLFFLSHIHADHIVGLDSTWEFPIHTSPINAKLLIHYIQVKQDLIRVLELDQAHIITLSDDIGAETVTVTLIDARHCPGSVMFLFQGRFGNILYTGDFRYEMDVIERFCLSNCDAIDTLYLDNTYCSPNCNHPPRQTAGDTVIQLIRDHPKAKVEIGMRRIGKEDLLVRIAKELGEWIVLTLDAYRKVRLLDLPDVFTTNEWARRVRVIPFTAAMAGTTSFDVNERLVILPSAITGIAPEVSYERRKNVYHVPYSDHSNFCELCKFVAKVRPRKVVPIVRNATNMLDMSVFDSLLDPSPPPVLESTPFWPTYRARPKSCRRATLAPLSKKASIRLHAKGVQYVDFESPPCDEDDEVVILDRSPSHTCDIEATVSTISEVMRFSDSSSEEDVGTFQTLDTDTETYMDVQGSPGAEQVEVAHTQDQNIGDLDVAYLSLVSCGDTPTHLAPEVSSGDGGSLTRAVSLSCKVSSALKEDDCRCLRFWKLDAVIVEALRRGGQDIKPVVIPETHICPYRKP